VLGLWSQLEALEDAPAVAIAHHDVQYHGLDLSTGGHVHGDPWVRGCQRLPLAFGEIAAVESLGSGIILHDEHAVTLRHGHSQD